MKTDKFDKIINEIFLELGDLKPTEDSPMGLKDSYGRLIYDVRYHTIGRISSDIPHLEFMERVLDYSSFYHVITQIWDRLTNIFNEYSGRKISGYYIDEKSDGYYRFYVNHN